MPPAVGHGGTGGSGGLDCGSAGCLCHRTQRGAGASWKGLLSVGCIGSGRGVAGAVALVLDGLAGLRHSCRGSGNGCLLCGEPGRGIRVAIRRILFLACRRSSLTWAIFLWWSAAHNSTLPWKVAKCWLPATLALARKARVLFTRESWVAWHICRWLSSSVCSRMACQTLCASI